MSRFLGSRATRIKPWATGKTVVTVGRISGFKACSTPISLKGSPGHAAAPTVQPKIPASLINQPPITAEQLNARFRSLIGPDTTLSCIYASIHPLRLYVVQV